MSFVSLGASSEFDPLVNEKIDYRVPEPARETSEKVLDAALLVLKVVIVPWGLYCLSKYAIQRLVMIPLYPAQSGIVKHFYPAFGKEALGDARESCVKTMQAAAKALHGWTLEVKEVSIEKNGVRYDGLLIGREETLGNGRWILQATGNGCPIEHMAAEFALDYAEAGFNTLLINGPSVGRSRGTADPQTMGEAQEAAITFLEEGIQAKDIAIAGHSLGGSAVGQAVLQHTFKRDVNYLVIRQMAFDRTSNIFKKVVRETCPCLKKFARSLVHWTGLEMDGVLASKRLQRLEIDEVIIQASSRQVEKGALPELSDFADDGSAVTASCTLGYRLVKEGVTEGKKFLMLPNAAHMGPKFIHATRDELLTHFGNS